MSDHQRNYDLQPAAIQAIDPIELSYQPPSPSLPHRIGLIGCGGISESHLQAYRHAGFEVTAFCDIDRNLAVNRRDQFYPEAKVYDDHLSLLRSSDVDVVDIATPARPRVPIIEAALKSGRHVLSQKPFVLDIDTGYRLADLADSHGRLLAVNQNGRWAPHFAYIRQAVLSGMIGEVVSVNISIHWDHNWIKGTPFDEMPHVVLEDFAIHWFDFVASIVPGVAEHVFASEMSSLSQTATPPLVASIVLRYPNTHVVMSFDADTLRGAEDRTVVRGTRGTLASIGPSLTDQTVTAFTEKGWFRPHLQGTWFREGFVGTMAELLCAIEQNRQPLNNARDNLPGLENCFSAVAACASQ